MYFFPLVWSSNGSAGFQDAGIGHYIWKDALMLHSFKTIQTLLLKHSQLLMLITSLLLCMVNKAFAFSSSQRMLRTWLLKHLSTLWMDTSATWLGYQPFGWVLSYTWQLFFGSKVGKPYATRFGARALSPWSWDTTFKKATYCNNTSSYPVFINSKHMTIVWHVPLIKTNCPVKKCHHNDKHTITSLMDLLKK